MNSGSDKTNRRSAEGVKAQSEYLRRYDDATLAAHLADLRDQVRETMFQFSIPMAHICEMARLSEERIEDAELRAEFLRCLIEVHEFGREAKRRGVGAGEAEQVRTEPAPRAGQPETALFAPTEGASDDVSNGVSRDFFASLDRPRRAGPSSRR